MLIEIHMIQNHSPSNLNRDDLNAPKTCIFGGVTRARISSQCLKRSIRRSPHLQAALESFGCVRTRSLIREVARRAIGNGEPPEKIIKSVRKVFEAGGVAVEAIKGDPDATNILFFVTDAGIQRMAEAVKSGFSGDELARKIAEALQDTACAPDIALSGRMTEFNAKGPFEALNFRVEAALQTAHPISTHAVVNEVDYWTAADDLPSGQGAAHINEAMFNSACFYKYFSLDWDQLVCNLTPRDAGDDAKQQARTLAACTLGHFLRAAALTTPTGKQNSFAAHNDPCGILVEIKKNGKTPVSYANAFAEPVERIGKPDDDAPDEKSIEGRSVACLADHVQALRRAYGLDSTLLWYSPKLWRFPFRYWERSEDGKRKEAKLVTNKRFDVLAGADGKTGALIEAVIKEIGFDWSKVRDAAKLQSAGTAS